LTWVSYAAVTARSTCSKVSAPPTEDVVAVADGFDPDEEDPDEEEPDEDEPPDVEPDPPDDEYEPEREPPFLPPLEPHPAARPQATTTASATVPNCFVCIPDPPDGHISGRDAEDGDAVVPRSR